MSAGAAGTCWLVTGAGGQLGRSLAAVAPEVEVEVVGLTHAELDICDESAVAGAIDSCAPGVVLNAAAFTAVDRCETELDAARRTNSVAPGILARACAGRALLIHVSTDYVFDGRSDSPIGEDAPTAPLSGYGRSKLEGEEAVRAAGGEHLIVRSSWLFGPGANFVRAILARAARRQPLRVVTDEVGRPTWTSSLARSLLDVARTPLRGTLHLANQGTTDRHSFAVAIVAEGVRRGWNPDVPVEPIVRADLALPAERPAHAVLSLARAEAAGIELAHWSDALVQYLDAEEEKRDA